MCFPEPFCKPLLRERPKTRKGFETYFHGWKTVVFVAKDINDADIFQSTVPRRPSGLNKRLSIQRLNLCFRTKPTLYKHFQRGTFSLVTRALGRGTHPFTGISTIRHYSSNGNSTCLNSPLNCISNPRRPSSNGSSTCRNPPLNGISTLRIPSSKRYLTFRSPLWTVFEHFGIHQQTDVQPAGTNFWTVFQPFITHTQTDDQSVQLVGWNS